MKPTTGKPAVLEVWHNPGCPYPDDPSAPCTCRAVELKTSHGWAGLNRQERRAAKARSRKNRTY